MTETIKEVLKRQFGFDDFRPGQADVIQHLVAHEDTLAILPTGAGKTLIYELYGAITPGTVVIVSPLLSLMQDQVARMQATGIKRVAALNSMLSFDDRRFVLQHLGQYQYVFVSPEMLSNPTIIQQFTKINLSLFVIDEAHCISQWGPDFRPDYLLLKQAIQTLHHPLTLMLTATATEQVRQDILRRLGLVADNTQVLVNSVNRPNIFLDVEEVFDPEEKDRRLVELAQQLAKPGIVYFSSKKKADECAAMLEAQEGVHAMAYHADLDADSRFKIQQQFMAGMIDIICATSAFGMGIDKNDIRFVIHYHMPADLVSYSQEIGRAGRDGKQSVAILLYQQGDEMVPASLAESSIPTEQTIRQFYQHPMLGTDDDQLRLLEFYYQHHVTETNAIQLFSERFFNKKAALNQVLSLVQTTGCRRKVLLQGFNETFEGHDDHCCDENHQIHFNDTLTFPARKPIKVKSNLVPWRQSLAQLFLADS